MKRILFFILFGMNFLYGYSQTEWKFIVGRYNTPVSLSWHSTVFNDIRRSDYKSVQNQGYIDVGGRFGREGVRFEAALGFAFYQEMYKAQIDSGFRVNGVGDYIFEKKYELGQRASNIIRPNLRLSSNFSLGEKNTLKLVVFNQGFSSWNAGLCLERRFGKKISLSALVYLPISSLEPFYFPDERWVLNRKTGGGIQMSYVISPKGKLKKEKSNRTPTVL